MKKLTILLLLLTLFGCEMYMEPSETHLSGGAWVFTDYQIAVISSISDVKVLTSDTICVNAFGEQSIVTGGVLMKQHYGLTMNDRKFIKGKTIWEFDFSDYRLFINRNMNEPYNVTYPSYMRYEKTEMEITNPYYGAVTNYTFVTDAMGANYPRKLTLTSPPIVSDLLLSNGMRDKAVTVRVILIFTR